MDIDVALVPSEARRWRGTVCIVIDELRASSTITTILDRGCSRLYVTAGLATARRLAREHGALLAGERHGLPPAGFDFDNSPADISRGDVTGRVVVLSTSNGTRVLSWLRDAPAAVVGCLLNARACAETAVALAEAMSARVGVVCAGRLGRFAIDDAVAAGVMVERLLEATERRGLDHAVTDEAQAAMRIRHSFADLVGPLRDSASGRLMTRLGAAEDIDFCARVDVSGTVGVLQPGEILAIERLTMHDGSIERVAAGRVLGHLAAADGVAANVG